MDERDPRDLQLAAYLPEPFEAPWWLRGPHAQTIGGRFLRGEPVLDTRRERVELPDGDFVDLDYAVAPVAADAPVALVLHGLEGCSRSTYVLHTLQELAAVGIQGVAMNFRSCSGEMNRADRFYHAGETGDLGHVLAHLRGVLGTRVTGAVGFSLGGNVLLKFLGERGVRAGEEIAAAVAISVPFDLSAGADNLERGVGRVYTRYFMRKLSRKASAKAAGLGERCDVRRVAAARTVREFDDAATAPLHGFQSAEQYYRESSSAQYLPRVRVPTLIVHALDDPFLPSRCIPVRAIEENPWLVSAIARRGGHVGFVGGTPASPHFWAERQAARFLAAHLAGSR